MSAQSPTPGSADKPSRLNIIFKVAGSLVCIGLIAYLNARDDNNDHKNLNTVIVIAQSLIMLLLWVEDKFKCRYLLRVSYIVWVWGFLFTLLSICVAIRFKDDKNKKSKYAGFILGNLALFVLAIAMAKCPFRKAKELQTPSPPTRSPKRSESEIKDMVNMRREKMIDEYTDVGIKVRDKTNTQEEFDRYNFLRAELIREGERPFLLDTLIM